MSQLLDDLPRELWETVERDLTGGRSSKRGRKGMTAEQVIRILIVKQMTGIDYAHLVLVLLEYTCYRNFCRIELGQPLNAKTLQRNVKRVSPESLEAIHQATIGLAQHDGIEDGKKLRADTTNVESNIHAPTDSSLLGDVHRVLVRLMKLAREKFGLEFSNHERRAKKRVYRILHAKNNDARVPLYVDLLKVTGWTMDDARKVCEELRGFTGLGPGEAALADGVAMDLEHFVGLGERVVNQTRRRVLDGEKVPSEDKLVSIFEPHTDILVKGKRKVEYGHMVCLSKGASGLVTDVRVLDGNPGDVTLTTEIVERHIEQFGHAPSQAAFDGAFASQQNLADLKAKGVQDVAFSKPCGLAITDMAKSTFVFKMLRNFRTAIEGTISFLKRAFSMRRVMWRGMKSFKSYIIGSVTAANLLLLARYRLAR